MSVDLYKLVIAAKLSKGDTPEPTGTLTITQNGTYDVADYASADVNVGGGSDETLRDLIEGDITELVVPNGTAYIRANCCANCRSLERVIIPNGVTAVTASSFQNCVKLASVTMGEDVASIGDSAFKSCSSLTSITCKATTPPTIISNTFTNVPSTCSIYVPASSVEAYKAASYWSNRAAYIQAIPE